MKISKIVFFLYAPVTFVFLSGCASTQVSPKPGATTTPELDAKFGDAVRAARAAMTLDPAAASKNPAVHSVDAKTAKEQVNALREQSKGAGSTN